VTENPDPLARVAVDQSVVVVIDVQNDFCHPDGMQAEQGKDVTPIGGVVDRLATFLSHARRHEVPIVFVRTTHSGETDSPEWLDRNTGPLRAQCCQDGTWGAEFYRVGPESGEEVVEKHRYNGFTATSLEDVLRGLGRRSLLFCGVDTNICVETTLREAVCRDFRATLVQDCCGSYTAAGHQRAIASIGAGFGLVTDSADIAAHWGRGDTRPGGVTDPTGPAAQPAPR
jgi:ureidoacrylate peracid hydrolase